MKTIEPPLNSPTLLWLMLGLSLGALPHFFYQPWWVSAIFISMVSWRVMHHWRGWPVPSPQHRSLKWVLSGLAASCLLLLVSQYGTTIGRDAGVALLIMMLGLKLVEIQSRRDVFISCYLGYFLIITNFFYTQSIPVMLLMFVVVTVMTVSLIGLHSPSQFRIIPRFRLAGSMLLQALPVMLLLFVLFPRVAGPLWGLPQDAHTATTGMDDKMTLGKISELIQSDAIAFRVKFEQTPPPASQLYWRGPVLWETDGTTWTELSQDKQLQTKPDITYQGQRYSYTITMEPHDHRWLFALDMPQGKPKAISSFITGDGQLRSYKKIQKRTQYKLGSQTDFIFNADSEPFVQSALDLPAGQHLRTVELAKTWHQQATDDHAYIQRVLQFFRKQDFYYTLTPPLIQGDPVDGFLFGSKRGFCEHYAASFTVLMRAAGIPARIVTGYLGGGINPVDNLLVVRQRDAHAWTEVWLKNEGWIRVDPTAAVSEARIERGIFELLPPERQSPRLISRSDLLVDVWQQLRNNWDALNSTWDLWVLAYGPETQKEFLSLLGMENPDWRKMTIWLVLTLTVVSSLIATLLLLQRRHTDPVVRNYQQFCDKLASVGLERQAHEGPLDFCRRAQAQLPQQRAAIQHITDLYIALRYQDTPHHSAIFHSQVRQFRPEKAL